MILGNGFDIKLGLKTSYKDFYNAFLVHNKSTWNIFDESDGIVQNVHPELCKMMNKRQFSFWSDLELLLGESVNDFDSLDRLREEKTYLEEELDRYLKGEEKRLQIVDPTKLKNRIDDTIIKVINLFEWDKEQAFDRMYVLDGQLSSSAELDNMDSITVQFVTFNYTDTISKIVDAINTVIRKMASKPIITYSPPLYIHGKLGDTVILGVDSYDQCRIQRRPITEKAVREEIVREHKGEELLLTDYKNKLCLLMLKPELNRTVRAQKVHQIENVINQSDKIIVFGSSLGETDNYWWKMIARWLIDEGKTENTVEEYHHQFGVLAYFKGMNSVSATAQAGIVEIENRFERIVNSVERGTQRGGLRKGMIEVKKSEDWMFALSDDGYDGSESIRLVPERVFSGLMMG